MFVSTICKDFNMLHWSLRCFVQWVCNMEGVPWLPHPLGQLIENFTKESCHFAEIFEHNMNNWNVIKYMNILRKRWLSSHMFKSCLIHSIFPEGVQVSNYVALWRECPALSPTYCKIVGTLAPKEHLKILAAPYVFLFKLFRANCNYSVGVSKYLSVCRGTHDTPYIVLNNS